MKKTIILAATVFLLAGAASAQKAHFGIKGGMNASSLNSDPNNSDLQTKIGFNAGLLAHIHGANAQWAFQPEVYYSAEGAKLKSNDSKINLGFVNVPVLVQYMFDNGFRIEAGPQIGFLLNAKQTKMATSDIKDQFKKTNFSIPVGLGYLTRTGLGFDARYNFGLSDISESSASKVHSNVFQFGIFYQFSDPKIKK
ncbi:MAG TPA: porin family protein [Hanamia sp.]|jgi:Outer membrane protein beta-barrel domain|nr:porin family protein [Hanamia sp.]